MNTYCLRLPPVWQNRIARLETPPAPAATARPAATKTLSRGERLRRGYAMLTDAAMRAAFRRRFWKELAS